MPDITMCANDRCPKASDCYRFMAVPSVMQAYGDFKSKRGKCKYFLELNEIQKGKHESKT